MKETFYLFMFCMAMLSCEEKVTQLELVSAESKILKADFIAEDTTIIQVGTTVHFLDRSTGNPNSWIWLFSTAAPASSTEQSPTATYNFPGNFSVELQVSNGMANDTLVRRQYIRVLD